MASTIGEKSYTNNNDHYSVKPPIFDREKFDYWKDIIESFFLGYDANLWDMVVDGYIHPVNPSVDKLGISKMSESQKKDNKNPHRS